LTSFWIPGAKSIVIFWTTQSIYSCKKELEKRYGFTKRYDYTVVVASLLWLFGLTWTVGSDRAAAICALMSDRPNPAASS
jgi:hypothetical protein